MGCAQSSPVAAKDAQALEVEKQLQDLADKEAFQFKVRPHEQPALGPASDATAIGAERERDLHHEVLIRTPSAEGFWSRALLLNCTGLI